ncbi:MAG: recombination protein RecR [Clostridia bacterium]|nr:recombination protein RecR [Clostridia bacterium]
MEYVLPLQRLIEKFCTLRGVGHKTAVRYAFSVLDMSEAEAAEFAEALISAKRDICPCAVCGNLSEGGSCSVCSDNARDTGVICVVEDSRAVMAIEKVKEYSGLYHVLGGVISPMDNIGPDQLRIKELLERINNTEVRELIIATNPNVEGETTAMYISKLVAPLGIKVSRLAYGVPVGADLEYADEMTLMRALDGRRQI